MIPLRRFLIEREHGRLPYPEGTACAEVLVANESRRQPGTITSSTGLARRVQFFKFLTVVDQHYPRAIVRHEDTVPASKGELGMDLSPALFGVGYILGPTHRHRSWSAVRCCPGS